MNFAPVSPSSCRGGPNHPTCPSQFGAGTFRFLSSTLGFKDPIPYNVNNNHHHHHRGRPCSGYFNQVRLRKFGSSPQGRTTKSAAGSSSSSSSRFSREVVEDEDGVDYEVEEDEEDVNDHQFDELSCFRGLVLDISYRPINVVCWRRAITLEFMEKADVLEYYDQAVSSSRGPYYIPAVLRVPNLLQAVKRRRVKQVLSRKNILFRDAFTCQYCTSHDNLTIDHVLPASRGGEWKWENLVTACSKCNSKKGKKTVEEAGMKLLKTPKAPKDFDIHGIPLTTAALKTLKMRRNLPDEWREYLTRPSSEN